ncbi:MFS transporter [Candidatus Micrarchaeota archaeon]|nr:MFS transporter [Candidatus Micrarchaeota archaeon]
MAFASTFRKNQKLGNATHLVALVVVFWAFFDSMLTYMAPLVMAYNGFSNTQIGLLIGSSSIAGLIFDFVALMLFKRPDYRKFFMIMLAICMFYPLALGGATQVWGYLLAMILWGLYFDLYGLGMFSFVSQYVERKNHAAAFGEILAGRSIGTSFAPLLVGFLLVGGIYLNVFLVAEFFIVVAIAIFLLLLKDMKGKKPLISGQPIYSRNIFSEFNVLRITGEKLWAPLMVTFFLFFVDAFFWTLAPLYAMSLDFSVFGGLFLAAYSIPFLLSGAIVGKVAKHFGNMKTAFGAMFLGTLAIFFFMFVSNPVLILLLVFASAFCFGISLASINGAYADFISSAPKTSRETASAEDSAFNFAYIVGPVAGGLLSDLFGIPTAFSILGAIGICLILLVGVKSKFRFRVAA